MELKELTKKEFDAYALNHPLGSFQQTSLWGRFMEGDKFYAYYVGAFSKEKIVGASLLLSYEYKKGKERIFYAPRGFLIDYKDENLLKEFTKAVRSFIIEKHGIFLKIDPYILLRDRNSNGDIIEGGVDNDFVKINLSHANFIKVVDRIQPRWLSRINLKNKTLKDIFNNFSSKARQIIRRNERFGFMVRELDFKNLDKFLDIIDKKSKKYHTIVPTKTFYEDLRNCFTDEYLHFKEVYFKREIVISNIDKEINQLLTVKARRIDSYHNSKMTEKYFIDKELEVKKELERLKSLKEFFSKCADEVSMGIYMFITLGNEVVLLDGGILDEYARFASSYTLHYEMIKYAIDHGYKYYNLYEIGDITDSNNRLNNSFKYKKNFGGEVVELVGEYDFIIDEKKTGLARRNFPKYLGVKTTFKYGYDFIKILKK